MYGVFGFDVFCLIPTAFPLSEIVLEEVQLKIPNNVKVIKVSFFIMSCPEIWLQVKIDFTLLIYIPYLVFDSLKINVILFHYII